MPNKEPRSEIVREVFVAIFILLVGGALIWFLGFGGSNQPFPG